MPLDALILGVHAIATAMMAGLIWFVQVVHYPMFADFDRGRFAEIALRHQRLTGRVVAPIMLAELVSAALVLSPVVALDGADRAAAWAGAALLAVVWASTVFLQVPCHRRLARAFDADAVRRLVATNWIRTIAWSARAVLAMALLRVHAPV